MIDASASVAATAPWTASKELKRVGLIALVLLTSVIAMFTVIGPSNTFSSPILLALLNLTFQSVGLFVVAWVANRSYLGSGLPQLLLISSSMIVFGTAVLINSLSILIIPTELDTNFLITGHNIGLLLFAFLNLLAVLLIIFEGAREPKFGPRTNIFLGLALSALLAVLVISFAGAGLFPTFWVGGSTLTRDLVLAVTIFLLLIATILLTWLYSESRSSVVYWYTLGLAAYAIGTYSILVAIYFDGSLIWAGRIAQYMGSVFLLLTVFASLKGDRWTVAFSRSRVQFDYLFANMAEAFAYLRAVRNDRGEPADYVYVKVNDAFRELTSTQVDPVGLRGSDVDCVMPDFLSFIREVDTKGRMARSEAYHEASRRWFSATAYSVEKGYYAVMFDDITDIKRAQQRVERSERLFRAAIENFPDVFNIYDSEGRLLYVNRKALERTGLREEDLIGRRDDEVPTIPPTICDQYLPALKKTYETGETQTCTLALSPDLGGAVQIVHYVPVKDETDRVVNVLGITTDMTERLKMEEELRHSNAELQQFAYVASHDLQEPLRMVTSYLSLLERRYKPQLDERAQEYIHNAVSGSLRMRSLIDDLLAYSRVETASKGLAPVDMNEVASETLGVLNHTIADSGAEVHIEPLPTVLANRIQMVQVLQNLIGNAIKFRGVDRPRVEVRATDEQSEWRFMVKDNGIGLNTEYAEKIFQMFQRLHTTEQYPGTGVGLAIAKKIVEKHGGRIWVESEEGKGATFYFTIRKSGGI